MEPEFELTFEWPNGDLDMDLLPRGGLPRGGPIGAEAMPSRLSRSICGALARRVHAWAPRRNVSQ
jgi:hypothetical protein